MATMQMSAEQLQQLVAGLGQVVVQALQQHQNMTGQPTSAAAAAADEKTTNPKTQLNVKGFEGIETFTGGEEGWVNWSWKAKVAISAMHEELVDVMKAAEAREGKNVKEILCDIDELEELNHEKRIKASKELYSLLVRYTGSEAATIVRSTAGLDGVEAWGKLRASYSRRTLGRMFLVQR